MFNVKSYAASSEFCTFFEDKVKVRDVDEVKVRDVPCFLQCHKGYFCTRGFNFGYKGFKVGVFTGKTLYVEVKEDGVFRGFESRGKGEVIVEG